MEIHIGSNKNSRNQIWVRPCSVIKFIIIGLLLVFVSGNVPVIGIPLSDPSIAEVPSGEGISKEQKVKFKKGPFFFDGSITRATLENYLSRSVTMGYFFVPGTPEKYEFPYRIDDIRFIRNTGACPVGYSQEETIKQIWNRKKK